MDIDLGKYGFYVWMPTSHKWVCVYFGFKQVIVELRDDYRSQAMCTCVEKKRPEILYNIPDDAL